MTSATDADIDIQPYRNLLHSPLFDSETQARIDKLNDKALIDEMVDANVYDRLQPALELVRLIANDRRYAPMFAKLLRFNMHNTEMQNVVRTIIIPFLKLLLDPQYIDGRNEASHKFAQSIKPQLDDSYFPYI